MKWSANLARPGAWRSLWGPALTLMAHLERESNEPLWTFGGGTVLMLRYEHRQSKDIDLFVPDPQYLGYLTPRLSDAGEAVSTDYVEAASYLKFYLPDGEIDIVAGALLTDAAFDVIQHDGRRVRVETAAEIIAKKFWHRGDQGKARDLFDLCAAATREPDAIVTAAPFIARHARAFTLRLSARADIAREEYSAIDRLRFEMPFDEAVELAASIMGAAIQQDEGELRRACDAAQLGRHWR